MIDKILNYFDELIPNPACELVYNNEYEFLIAVCLSAQTTDKSVNNVTKVLFKKYKTLNDLSCADIEDIKKIIRPIGTFNKKSVYIKQIATTLINKFDGKVPKTCKELESIPGVGHKTASLVLGTLYNKREFPVDTHVNRVSKRLGICSDDDTVKVVEEKLKKIIPPSRWIRTHHQMVLFGRYYCKSVNPQCDKCKIKELCKY